MLLLGAQKGYPPWAVSPPQIKRRPPPISKTHPAVMSFFYACFRSQSIKQWNLIFPHPSRKNVFAIWQFQDAKTLKNTYPYISPK